MTRLRACCLVHGPSGWSGHTQHVQEAVGNLEHQQDVEPPQGHLAVDVEEADREHAAGLRAQELPPTGVGVLPRSRRDPVALQDPPDRRGAHAIAESEQLTLDPHVPQRGFSRAIRTIKAASTSSIGGRPVRLR
jgi:hypothetical protein